MFSSAGTQRYILAWTNGRTSAASGCAGAQTGTVMISPLPGAWPERPGSATLPFFGVVPVIVDDKARSGFPGLCASPTGPRSGACRCVCLL